MNDAAAFAFSFSTGETEPLSHFSDDRRISPIVDLPISMPSSFAAHSLMSLFFIFGFFCLYSQIQCTSDFTGTNGNLCTISCVIVPYATSHYFCKMPLPYILMAFCAMSRGKQQYADQYRRILLWKKTLKFNSVVYGKMKYIIITNIVEIANHRAKGSKLGLRGRTRICATFDIVVSSHFGSFSALVSKMTYNSKTAERRAKGIEVWKSGYTDQ